MKIGIIRCRMTEDYCPGTSDFKAIRERSGVFADVPADEPIELVGFNNCGGCPGKKAAGEARRRHDRFCFLHPEGKSDRLSVPIREKNEGHHRRRPEGRRTVFGLDALVELGVRN